MRWLLAFLLLIPAAVHAQTVQDRLTKAQTELNNTQNAAARSEYALKQIEPQTPAVQAYLDKALTEVNATKNDATRGLYDVTKALTMQQTCPDASVISIYATCPSLPTGAAPIPTTDFDISTAMAPSQVPGDNGVDPVGAFRFICGAGQLRYDDPIVYPGQPGKSHLHQFYGNTDANAYSTFTTLRAHGNSTCNTDGAGHAANRSAYWMPAMLDGRGHVVQPDFISIYYKRLPASNPQCNDISRTDLGAEGICVPIPNGIKFIFGYDMVTNTARTGGNQFMCIKGNSSAGSYANLTDLAKGGCPVGDKIELTISAPTCWDGKRLDSPNHRDHVSYPTYGSWGYRRCDAAHPYVMPRFLLSVFYAVIAGDDLSLWHLSSDEMRPELPHGATFHADYFEGWDDKTKVMWTAGCIDGHRNCSGGNMGNGFTLRGAARPSYGWVNPNRLVPVPPKP